MSNRPHIFTRPAEPVWDSQSVGSAINRSMPNRHGLTTGTYSSKSTPNLSYHNSTASLDLSALGPRSRPGSATRSSLTNAGAALSSAASMLSNTYRQNATLPSEVAVDGPAKRRSSTEELLQESSSSSEQQSNGLAAAEEECLCRPSGESSNSGTTSEKLENMGSSSHLASATMARMSPDASVADALDALCIQPHTPVASPKETWECLICFETQQTRGWKCPEGHRFCETCMRHHVKAVAFPRCPQVNCGFELDASDLRLLKVSRKRIEAFEHCKLQSTIETLGSDKGNGHTEDRVVHCHRDGCSNVVLVPRDGCRKCFACPCGAPSMCTHCGEIPYHHHAGCMQVHGLRRRWLDWVSEARTMRKKYAEALAALQQRIQQDKDLRNDEIWKSIHCRLCPSCCRVVEKIDGCNAMTCGQDTHGGNKQAGCGARFDWDKALPYTMQTKGKQALETKFKVTPQEASRGKGIFHPGVECKSCKELILGPRLRCIHCENFDVCANCEAALDNHDLSHVFEVLYKSSFDWSEVRLAIGVPVRVIRSGTKDPPIWFGNQFDGRIGDIVGIIEDANRSSGVCKSTCVTYKVSIRGHKGSNPELPPEHVLPLFRTRWDAKCLLEGCWGKPQPEEFEVDMAAFMALVAKEGALFACRAMLQ